MKYRILLLLIVLCSTSFNAQNNNPQPKRIIDSVTISNLNNSLVQTQALLKAKSLVTSEELKIHEEKIIEKIDSKNILTNVLPILVVALGAFLALLQMRLNTISKARIEWAENLRISIAKFASSYKRFKLNIIQHKLAKKIKSPDIVKERRAKLLDDLAVLLSDFEECETMVCLYLNRDNLSHNNLYELIKDARKHINETHSHNSGEIEAVTTNFDVNDVIEASNLVLKKSWEDAKSFKDFWPWSGKKKVA